MNCVGNKKCMLLLKLIFIIWFSGINADQLQFLELPRDQKVSTSEYGALFLCRANGVPKPSVTWLRNGREIKNNVRFRVVPLDDGSTLHIDPVHARHSGVYECVAENTEGAFIKAEANLTVFSTKDVPIGFPNIVTYPKTKAVELGFTAGLKCEADGFPKSNITWFKDNKPINLTNTQYNLLESGDLTITQTTTENEGRYQCRAENALGSTFSSSAILYIRVRRVLPKFVEPLKESHFVKRGDNLNISCFAVGSPKPTTKWIKKGNDNAVIGSENVMGKNIFILKNIQKSDKYECIAQSPLGIIRKETSVTIKDGSTSSGSLFQVTEMTYSDARDQIKAVVAYDENLIQIEDISESNEKFVNFELSSKNTVNMFLEPCTKYSIIMNFNWVSNGSITNQKFDIESIEAYPFKPTASVTSVSSNNVTLSMVPAATGCVPKGYEIKGLGKSTWDAVVEETEAVTTAEGTITLDNLYPDTNYVFTVVPFNDYGTNAKKSSTTVKTRTQSTVPNPVSKVEMIKDKLGAVTGVKWIPGPTSSGTIFRHWIEVFGPDVFQSRFEFSVGPEVNQVIFQKKFTLDIVSYAAVCPENEVGNATKLAPKNYY